jgi:phosphoglycerol transferase
MLILALSLIFFLIALLFVKYRRKHHIFVLLHSKLFFLYLFLLFSYFGVDYFTGNGFDESVLITLNLGIAHAGFGEYVGLISLAIVGFVGLFALSYLYYRLIKEQKHPQKRLKAILHNTFFLLAFATLPIVTDIYGLYTQLQQTQTDDFSHYYKRVLSHTQKTPSQAYNIVYIYAESLERTYFDEAFFPQLVPNLKNLQKKSIDFTNIQQVARTGVTIAGIVASECGTPFFAAGNSENYNTMRGSSSFLKNAECIGDILKEQEYYLSFMQGASLAFAGKGNFFKTHSFDMMEGREELKDRVEDKSYLNGWGLYDDTLFELAFEKFLQLSKSKKKFGLFLLSVDTHHPNGQLSKSCRDDLYGDGTNSILNCVKCSDAIISRFINRVQKSKYGKNTLIVLTSDHLAMHNTASELLNKAKERRNLFLIIPPKAKAQQIDQAGSTLDIGATVLAELGIAKQLGLGRDLRSQKTLLATMKKEQLDKKIYAWRDAIVALWDFPKLPKKAKLEQNRVKIASESYELPVLIKVKKNSEIAPVFEFYSHTKLHRVVANLKEDERFLWIDRCAKIDAILQTHHTGEYCAMMGMMGADLQVKSLQNAKEFSLAAIQKQTASNLEKYKTNRRYFEAYEKAISFSKESYPPFIKSVKGLSHKEKWGRWSDADIAKEVEIVFKAKLPKNFLLHLEMGAYGANIDAPTVVKAGDIIQTLRITQLYPKYYTLSFSGVDSSKLVFVPPHPQRPPGDMRKLGISFRNIWIERVD